MCLGGPPCAAALTTSGLKPGSVGHGMDHDMVRGHPMTLRKGVARSRLEGEVASTVRAPGPEVDRGAGMEVGET